MNLDLPFMEPERSALDEYLAAVDRELDSLFLDEVNGVLLQLRAERADAADDAVA